MNSFSDLLTLAMALGFVLALMGLLAFALKKLNLAGPAITVGQKRRLKVIEVMNLDARRRLMIIKRDNTEHLVILGANGETIIESGFSSDEESAQNNKKINKERSKKAA